MRVLTRVEYEWTDDGELVVAHTEGYDYDGPVAECKGGGVANQQRKDELNMQKQAFAMQQQQLQFLNTNLSKYLTGNVGFDPQQYAQLQSQFLNNNADQFQQAGQGVRQALAARGGGLGDAPVSGDYVRDLSGLFGLGASSQSQGLLNLGIQNSQQALANKFNAASVLSGNAATLNGAQSVAGSGASSALNSYIQAQSNGFLNTLAGSFGGALGSGLGAGLTGGIGTSLSKIPWGGSGTTSGGVSGGGWL